VEKPWNNTRLVNIVSQQVKHQQTAKKNQRLQSLSLLDEPLSYQAYSQSMQNVLNQAKRAALSDVSILITGENGTGKSLLAKFIHQHSARSEQVLVEVNMGAIPENLFESELFGHKKGAFTDAKEDRLGRFEIANEGTLFLDEVGTIPMSQQSKLLRVLESQTFEMVGSSQTQKANVRVVAATNSDLMEAIENRTFRQDLLFRLNTIELHIPPLRERKEDIQPLAQSFLAEKARKYQREKMQLSDEAINELQGYHWPGNVRELSHCIERAVVLSDEDVVQAHHLNLTTKAQVNTTNLPLMTLDEAEKRLLINAIHSFDGNVIAAGEFLGLTKSTIYRRLEKHNLDPKQLPSL
jgi:DNA-binding NtrC family response regulator